MEERFIYLMFKKLNGNATVNELSEIVKIIESDLDLLEEAKSINEIWVDSQEIKVKAKKNKEDSWQLLKSKMEKKKQRKTFIRVFQIAATVLILVSMGFLFHRNDSVLEPYVFIYSNNEGNAKEVFLPDSTLVILNSGAQISYNSDFNEIDRKLILKGEAFFDVSANKHKPFIIQADKFEVRVLGTSFLVSRHEVAVNTGIVEIKQKNTSQKLILIKNQKVLIKSPTDSVMHIEEINQNQFASYTHRLVFESTPMKGIVNDLQRAYHTPIVINNQNIEELPLTISLKSESLEDALKTLNLLLDFTYEQKQDTLFIN